jgi:hypothetical protein
MSHRICSLLGSLTLIVVSYASVRWQEGPEPMPVPPIGTHSLQIANEGPDPMPVPPLSVL